jgi:hypothetical protein
LNFDLSEKMNEELSELVKPELAIAPVSIDSGVMSDYFPVSGYRKIRAIAFATDVAEGETLTVQLYQGKNALGGTPIVLGSAVVSTAVDPSNDESLLAEVCARMEELDADYTHVAVHVDTSDTGITGGAILEFAEPRFTIA